MESSQSDIKSTWTGHHPPAQAHQIRCNIKIDDPFIRNKTMFFRIIPQSNGF